jgi:hypothetical protein
MKNISPRFKKVISWLLRAFYISIIFGLLDFYSVLIHDDTLFSGRLFSRTRYTGFGYTIINYNKTGFENVRLQYWFSPIAIYAVPSRDKISFLSRAAP